MRPVIRSTSDISAPSLPRSYALRVSDACLDHKSGAAAPADFDAPVVGAPLIRRVAFHRPGEAIALRLELRRWDAKVADQHLAHGLGAAGGEREVVFGRPDVVRVALDGQLPIRML